MILVSACLLGENCKYSGGNNRSEAVLRYLEGKEYIPFCPELEGGLSVPRPPCEIRDDRVYTPDGTDCTAEFTIGARKALALCRETGVSAAILKERSPSCGSHMIYDGSFSGTKIPGQGVTARLLGEDGIALYSEQDIENVTGF